MVPGPDMAVVTKRAMASGWQDGLRTVGGITAGLLIRGVLTAVGLAAVLAASATAYAVVKLAGALCPGFLGVQTLLQSRRSRPVSQAASTPVGNPWRTGLVGNVCNPKITVFCTGLLPTLAPSGFSPHLGMSLLVLIHAALTLVCLGSYVPVPAKARTFFEMQAVRRTLDRITGFVLIGFGIKVATSQP
ncbi:LysE family translocator [Streptomyces sp. NBC_01102]|uniref:LysE family translocator n=1 Tax=unclassified Streptomyces TaxID=2593676 RepID=UPI0038641953|nr:LysE family translocator [Streptomyces sp. NBC_01102]